MTITALFFNDTGLQYCLFYSLGNLKVRLASHFGHSLKKRQIKRLFYTLGEETIDPDEEGSLTYQTISMTLLQETINIFRFLVDVIYPTQTILRKFNK